MSIVQLRASLALWRARFRWRDARWNHWKKAKNIALIAKWEKLRLEAIGNIHLRERQIQERLHPLSVTMYDSTDLSQIPTNAQAVAGYVGGNWPTYSKLAEHFPNAKHLSIAVNASEDAEVLDVEAGDATPADVLPWYQRQRARGLRRPVIYADLSTMPAVKNALRGIPRSGYRLWLADYDGNPMVPGGYDAKQFTDKAMGRNLDQSTCLPGFFG